MLEIWGAGSPLRVVKPTLLTCNNCTNACLSDRVSLNRISFVLSSDVKTVLCLLHKWKRHHPLLHFVLLCNTLFKSLSC